MTTPPPLLASLVDALNQCPDIMNARILAPGDRVPEVVVPTALRDQTATALEALAAERDALREALERVKALTSDSQWASITLSKIGELARATLNGAPQP